MYYNCGSGDGGVVSFFVFLLAAVAHSDCHWQCLTSCACTSSGETARRSW